MNSSITSGSIRILSCCSAVCVLSVITGCAVGPKYIRPATSVSETWQTPLSGGLVAGDSDPQALAAWWTRLNDTTLSNLIGRAAKNNLDVKQAYARVREARARQGSAKAGFFPTLDAAGSVRDTRKNGRTTTSCNAGFDAGWELDIFGGKRRSLEASTADLQASREELRDVLVSLLAEVASNYIRVRLYQSRLTVAESNLTAQRETSQLILWRYKAGLSDELAVQQAAYNLEITRASLLDLKTGLEEVKNRIAVLLGEQPGNIRKELEKHTPLPTPSLKLAVGVPADLLRRRPDIRRAERQLAAQTARIGEAVADLYPKFNLSGSIGLETLSPGKLFSASEPTSGGGALVTWPIFRGGTIRRNIEVQSAQQEQCLIAYEASVLGALEEVENALTAFANEQERRESLKNAMQSSQRAAELAQQEYQAGLADFTTVLDTQRSLLSIQDQLARSEGTVATNLVHLYKVLGGGWTSLVPEYEK